MSKKTNNKEKVNETIENIYYDPGGFGTVYETYKDAKAKNKLVTLDSVKDWFTTNVERKTQLRGYNSYVSKGPEDEFEVDLFFLNYLGEMTHGYPVGFLAIDNFTKYMWVVPLENKSGSESYGETEKDLQRSRTCDDYLL